jgi:hypothetical protein
MGFGAVITSGDNNTLLRDDLLNFVTEVRVEQSLDDPTRFAIRFEDDICGGKFEVMHDPDLQCGKMISVAVQVGKDLRCLVRGPITDSSASFMLGGPGTTYDIRGEDRRVELDRQCIRRAWTDRASVAAQTILSPQFKNTSIQTTDIVYGARRSNGREVLQTLNQRSTNAYFLACIARDNNFHFWLEYTCNRAGNTLKIDETANLKPSPPRPAGEKPSNQLPIKLATTTKLKLRVNVPAVDCPNVTTFSLKMDAERPNRSPSLAINDREAKPKSTPVNDPQPPIEKTGNRFPGLQQIDRDVCIVTAGNEDELHARGEASLTEAGWFLNASASTTAHMLDGILLPHDVIEVEGLGTVHDGAYQVKSVTHVINAADHYMDLELRRNALGK